MQSGREREREIAQIIPRKSISFLFLSFSLYVLVCVCPRGFVFVDVCVRRCKVWTVHEEVKRWPQLSILKSYSILFSLLLLFSSFPARVSVNKSHQSCPTTLGLQACSHTRIFFLLTLMVNTSNLGPLSWTVSVLAYLVCGNRISHWDWAKQQQPKDLPVTASHFEGLGDKGK